MRMEDVERVYTLQEAAERLHMPYRSLRDAVFADRWPHRKISQRRRLMTEEDIRAVLAMSLQEAKPPMPASEMRSIRSSVKARLTAA